MKSGCLCKPIAVKFNDYCPKLAIKFNDYCPRHDSIYNINNVICDINVDDLLFIGTCCRLRYLCHILHLHGVQYRHWAGRVLVVEEESQTVVKNLLHDVIHLPSTQTVQCFLKVYVSSSVCLRKYKLYNSKFLDFLQ